MEKIILYSTNCPKCKMLKDRLDTAKVQYIVESNIEKMIEMGISTIPMLEVDGELMDFVSSLRWIGGRKTNESLN